MMLNHLQEANDAYQFFVHHLLRSDIFKHLPLEEELTLLLKCYQFLANCLEVHLGFRLLVNPYCFFL